MTFYADWIAVTVLLLAVFWVCATALDCLECRWQRRRSVVSQADRQAIANEKAKDRERRQRLNALVAIRGGK